MTNDLHGSLHMAWSSDNAADYDKGKWKMIEATLEGRSSNVAACLAYLRSRVTNEHVERLIAHFDITLACDLFCEVHRNLGHGDVLNRDAFFGMTGECEPRRRAWIEIAKLSGTHFRGRPDSFAYEAYALVHRRLADGWDLGREGFFDPIHKSIREAWTEIVRVLERRRLEVGKASRPAPTAAPVEVPEASLPDRVRAFLLGEHMRHQLPSVAREALACANSAFDVKRVRKVLWSMDLSREPAAGRERAEIVKAMRESGPVWDPERLETGQTSYDGKMANLPRKYAYPDGTDAMRVFKEAWPAIAEYMKKVGAVVDRDRLKVLRRQAKVQRFGDWRPEQPAPRISIPPGAVNVRAHSRSGPGAISFLDWERKLLYRFALHGDVPAVAPRPISNDAVWMQVEGDVHYEWEKAAAPLGMGVEAFHTSVAALSRDPGEDDEEVEDLAAAGGEEAPF